MRFIPLILASILLAACVGKEKSTHISADRAREIATLALNARVKEERFQDAAGAWHRYPEFQVSDWKSVVFEKGRWMLRLYSGFGAGHEAYVTLKGDGSDIRVEAFGFAIE